MKTIFLDRDGVINKYPGDTKYVTRWKDFRFLPGVKKAIAALHKNRFKLFIISNQAGVGKGLFTKKALASITKNMLREIKAAGGAIAGVYYCTHRKEENCLCRKPKTGLIDLANKERHLAARQAFFIGDTIPDIHTAKAAGLRSILVLGGKEKLTNQKHWETQPDLIFKGLREAADFIIKAEIIQ